MNLRETCLRYRSLAISIPAAFRMSSRMTMSPNEHREVVSWAFECRDVP